MRTTPKAGLDSEIVKGTSNDHDQPGVYGLNTADSPPGPGVLGAGPVGVEGSGGEIGVHGKGAYFGVQGERNDFTSGFTEKGFLACLDPVFQQRAGVYGESAQQGVMGITTSDSGTGVYGGGAAHAHAPGSNCIGVRGETFTGVGVQGQSFDADGLAGKFIGNIEVTGNLHMSSGTSDIVLGDIAEGFQHEDGKIIEPGTVVVLNQQGFVRPGDEAYDKKVAGVVSGAGNYRPAIVLDKQRSQASHLSVALVGKVCCKVDAQYSSIAVGDLLTTSPTPGHAMKAVDPVKAFGSVIGKALRPLNAGRGMIPILIVLQ
jgi:hypothetical protein